MDIFNLPDLGEGLPDAEIHEWFVKEGDTVTLDQPLASMETAKALVDLPCPQSGVIAKLFGKPGEVIKTGDPFVAFVSKSAVDKGTVVGNLEESAEITEDHFTYGLPAAKKSSITATPTAKILAKKLGLDLQLITGTGDQGIITRQDVQAHGDKKAQLPQGYEVLHGIRRAMLNSMVLSKEEVVPVCIFDEADVQLWGRDTDITVRLIRAVAYAATCEPALNAWFDTQHSARKCLKEVHLGLAMDNEEGLFVPVLHDVGQYSDPELRQMINELKQAVGNRSIPVDKLKGASITLSNFGKFAGRFANPIIVPPTVAILAVGKLYKAVVPTTEEKMEIHSMLPLSLSFDHRAVTGGEATRFLGAVIDSLQSPPQTIHHKENS